MEFITVYKELKPKDTWLQTKSEGFKEKEPSFCKITCRILI